MIETTFIFNKKMILLVASIQGWKPDQGFSIDLIVFSANESITDLILQYCVLKQYLVEINS